MLARRKTTRLLILGFAAIVALMIIVQLTAIRETDTLSELTGKIYRHPFAVSNAVLAANAHIISMHRHMKDVALSQDDEALETAIASMDADEAEVLRHFEIVMERFLGDKAVVEEALEAFSGIG
jgi:phage tail protein X